MQILGATVDKHSKGTISKNMGPLSAIFLDALDFRRETLTRDKAGGNVYLKLDETETLINAVSLKAIYKLNDATFRPVFSRIIEWSESKLPDQGSRGRILRQQSVYAFLSAFFESLKSAVTSYASYIVDSAASILQEVDLNTAEYRELWKRVLKTLVKCFEHDQEDFWQAPSHFAAIAPALAEQFLHATTLDVSTDLIPAVVELAARADSQAHRKELNGSILKHVRSEHSAVRLAAVLCQQALIDRPGLGEDWLAMLPELLPYISELQDDDDEVVERETQRWIVKIEGVLGESLDTMLL